MKNFDTQTLLDFGLETSQKISEKIQNISLQKPLGTEIGTIGCSGDSVKIGDTEAEHIIFDEIDFFLAKNNTSEYKIILISEETGIKIFGDENAENGFFIILDPIDGSNNLRPWKTPSPFVSTSLALGSLASLEKNNTFDAIEVGIVQDIFNSRTYYATKNKGAFVKNFGAIQASPLENMQDAVLGIDFDVQDEVLEKKCKMLLPLLQEKKCQRRLGSSILDMAKVACGEYDAFLSLMGYLKIHDVAAVQLILKEAGGVIKIIEKKEEVCLIKKIIATRDNNLLKNNTFTVIASGNRVLQRKIETLLPINF
jgi:fructose-1,6-bisphosphatase/inositol monophosphatase family enzyme